MVDEETEFGNESMGMEIGQSSIYDQGAFALEEASSLPDEYPAPEDVGTSPGGLEGSDLQLNWMTPEGELTVVPAQGVQRPDVPDMATLDTDGNGGTDTWLYDTAGTGQANVMLVDNDGDGNPDGELFDLGGTGDWVSLEDLVGPASPEGGAAAAESQEATDVSSGEDAAAELATEPYDAHHQLLQAAQQVEAAGNSELATHLQSLANFFLGQPLAQPWVMEDSATTPEEAVAEADAWGEMADTVIQFNERSY